MANPAPHISLVSGLYQKAAPGSQAELDAKHAIEVWKPTNLDPFEVGIIVGYVSDALDMHDRAAEKAAPAPKSVSCVLRRGRAGVKRFQGPHGNLYNLMNADVVRDLGALSSKCLEMCQLTSRKPLPSSDTVEQRDLKKLMATMITTSGGYVDIFHNRDTAGFHNLNNCSIKLDLCLNGLKHNVPGCKKWFGRGLKEVVPGVCGGHICSFMERGNSPDQREFFYKMGISVSSRGCLDDSKDSPGKTVLGKLMALSVCHWVLWFFVRENMTLPAVDIPDMTQFNRVCRLALNLASELEDHFTQYIEDGDIIPFYSDGGWKIITPDVDITVTNMSHLRKFLSTVWRKLEPNRLCPASRARVAEIKRGTDIRNESIWLGSPFVVQILRNPVVYHFTLERVYELCADIQQYPAGNLHNVISAEYNIPGAQYKLFLELNKHDDSMSINIGCNEAFNLAGVQKFSALLCDAMNKREKGMALDALRELNSCFARIVIKSFGHRSSDGVVMRGVCMHDPAKPANPAPTPINVVCKGATTNRQDHRGGANEFYPDKPGWYVLYDGTWYPWAAMMDNKDIFLDREICDEFNNQLQYTMFSVGNEDLEENMVTNVWGIPSKHTRFVYMDNTTDPDNIQIKDNDEWGMDLSNYNPIEWTLVV